MVEAVVGADAAAAVGAVGGADEAAGAPVVAVGVALVPHAASKSAISVTIPSGPTRRHEQRSFGMVPSYCIAVRTAVDGESTPPGVIRIWQMGETAANGTLIALGWHGVVRQT